MNPCVCCTCTPDFDPMCRAHGGPDVRQCDIHGWPGRFYPPGPPPLLRPSMAPDVTTVSVTAADSIGSLADTAG